MATRRKKGSGKLFRGFVSYFAIILVPVMLIAIFAYQRFWHKSQEDMSARIHMSLTGSIKGVDSAVDIAQNACMSLFYDQRVRQHLRPIVDSTEEDRLAQIHIHQQITTLTNLTGGIAESMFVYLDGQNVFSDGLYAFDDYFGKICVYEDYDADFWRALQTSSRFLTILPATSMTRYPQTRRAVIPLVYSARMQGYDVVSVMTLSIANISATIRSGVITDDTRMLLLDGDGGTIYSELTASEAAALALADGQDDAFTLRADGRAFMAIQAASGLTGWRYTLLVPMAQITTLSSDFLLSILLLVAAFILASGLALYFARRITRPIRRIYTALEDDTPQPIAPDLEAISRHVTSVLSDYQEAREERDTLQGKYVELALLQLLSGRGDAGTDRLQRMLTREYGFDDPVYQCVVLRLAFDWGGEQLQDTERLNLQVNLLPDLTAFIARDMPCYVLEPRDDEYAFLLNHPQGGDARAYALFASLLASLRENDRIASVHISVARESASLSDLGGAYRQAAQMLAAIPRAEAFCIGYADEAPRQADIRYPLKEVLRLTNTLRAGDREKVFLRVNALLDGDPTASDAQQAALIQDIYLTAMRFLAERDGTAADRLAYQGLRAEADLPGGLAEKRALLEKLLNVLLTAGQPAVDEGLTANIIRYVQENFASDLYLERIAEEMGLSVKYISRVFKTKTGQNLSDYINQVRVEHVKDLLIHTDQSISEISASVGIHSRTTFLRIFRKHEGVTPSEYRELARGEDATAQDEQKE